MKLLAIPDFYVEILTGCYIPDQKILKSIFSSKICKQAKHKSINQKIVHETIYFGDWKWIKSFAACWQPLVREKVNKVN